MNNIKVHKLNESFSVIDGDIETLQKMNDFLKVERPGAYFEPLVKSGWKSPFEFFASIQHEKLLVMNGHLSLLHTFGVTPNLTTSEFDENQVNKFLEDVKKTLPFPPYDFQEKAFTESILNSKQINKMCTGSGKSMTISLIAEFLRRQNKKGLLLVPNINLLTQFKSDIRDYNLIDLYNDTHTIGGGNSDKHFNCTLTISTWQSLQNWKEDLDKLDYIICDEAHRFASEVTSEIVKDTVNCKMKWAFTGTLPESPIMKMQLFGLFGLPKAYITSRQLIDRGLATPIDIKTVIFNYNDNEKSIFAKCGKLYSKQLAFLKTHEKRNEFVVSLTCKAKTKGNSLLLFQHTEHGKGLFIDIMKKIHPGVNVQNKDITGKKSFEFQEQYGIYFLNGEDNAQTRERTRKILEEHDDAVLVANFSLLSTGVNIKKLHNLILASPLKAYTTVTQSIGRGMRLHSSKEVFTVYDLVDNFGKRKPGGVFWKQYQHRLKTSYNPEEFPVKEMEYSL